MNPLKSALRRTTTRWLFTSHKTAGSIARPAGVQFDLWCESGFHAKVQPLGNPSQLYASTQGMWYS